MLSRALRYFRPDLSRIVIVLACMLGAVVLGVLWPVPLAVLIDTVFAGKHSDNWLYRATYILLPTSSKTAQIVALASMILALRISSIVLQTIQTFINIRVGYNGQMRVRCDLFAKLQALSIAYHRSQPQGDAIYRLSSDTNGFQSLLNTAIGTLVNIVTLAAIASVMFSFNWRLTLVALGVAPLLYWTIRAYGNVLKRRYAESYKVQSELTTTIQRSLSSIGLVQAFGRETDEFQRFHSTVGNNVKVQMRLHLDEVMYWLILGVILGIGAAAIFGYGGWLVHRGALEVGMLTVFLFYLEKLYEPLNKLSASGSSFHGAMEQVRRVFEVLDRDPIIRDAPGAIALPRKPRTLSFDHVWFSYREDRDPVLQDVNVAIEPGQMVAFVGSSGVGKTTLLNLLPRFYDPTRGALKLDEHDARAVKVSDLRKHVALVLQESVILPTTVRENIAYGRPDATDAQIVRAAELAGATAFIDKLDQKYDTPISESGTNLSGGQRQRITIARALVTDAPFIVLDEPTSALDPQHEQMITATLRDLKRSRTIILVSHRLSTVFDCDQIFVMDEGRIVERGTHGELIAKRGLYFDMAKHQLKLQDTHVAQSLSDKLRIIVTGMVGQYPLGGVAWDYFHYVLGLAALGHDVYYHEDTWTWPLSPTLGYATDDPTASVKFIADFFARYAPHLSARWHYLFLHDKSFGMSREAFDEVARTADIFLNVSGACFFPDQLNPKCIKVFVDTDPGYNQIMLAEKFAWSENVERWCDQVRAHDVHLTYAENMYGDDCTLPRVGIDWRPTRCVVTLADWASVKNSPPPTDAPFTTVMSWSYFKGKLIHRGVEYGAKAPEFEKFIDLPTRTNVPLMLAIAGQHTPTGELKRAGWNFTDAWPLTLTAESYVKFIADSAGEWSVAKNCYVATNSGWFSCRTACYLAAGRPAVVQETGWSKCVPSGKGVIAFTTIEEAERGLTRVSNDIAGHRASAYDVAREYLAHDRVLPEMLATIYR